MQITNKKHLFLSRNAFQFVDLLKIEHSFQLNVITTNNDDGFSWKKN